MLPRENHHLFHTVFVSRIRYCWSFRNPAFASWYGQKHIIIYRVSYIPGGDRRISEPSTDADHPPPEIIPNNQLLHSNPSFSRCQSEPKVSPLPAVKSVEGLSKSRVEIEFFWCTGEPSIHFRVWKSVKVNSPTFKWRTSGCLMMFHRYTPTKSRRIKWIGNLRKNMVTRLLRARWSPTLASSKNHVIYNGICVFCF